MVYSCLGPGGYPAPPPHQIHSIHLPRQPPGTPNFIQQIPPAPSGYPIAAPAPRMTMGAPTGPPPPPALPRQNLPTDLQSLADTIAQATSLIQVGQTIFNFFKKDCSQLTHKSLS